jgi:hypothetical protein
MNRYIIIVTFLTLSLSLGFSQNKSIEIPEYNDNYCNSIKLLETGKTDIDYKAFRESFLDSKQFKIALNKSTELRDLTNAMYDLMSKKKYDEIISTSKKILSIDYTNIRAHKILRQTYKIKGDTINAKKYKTIQFGLLKSIVYNRDGKSCETAWEVIQVSEEYFILDMLGAEFQRQSIDYSGGICDKMEVLIDNKEKIYFFNVEKLLIAKQNLNKN